MMLSAVNWVFCSWESYYYRLGWWWREICFFEAGRCIIENGNYGELIRVISNLFKGAFWYEFRQVLRDQTQSSPLKDGHRKPREGSSHAVGLKIVKTCPYLVDLTTWTS